MTVPRLRLAHLPTPLWHNSTLDELVGAEVWVKRDDMTAGAAAGNKIRKLEYLLADAQQDGATVLLTCGGIQSNHARATATLGRTLGLRSVLFLRCDDPNAPQRRSGNLMLDELLQAELRLISPEEYRNRQSVMAEAALELASDETPYIIPEGGSNGRGALGYVSAMAEVRAQLDLGLGPGPDGFDAVVSACGSGGTTAGLALGAAREAIAPRVIAMAVCDTSTYFQETIERILGEACALRQELRESADIDVYDAYKGPRYAVPSPEQVDFIREVAAKTGLITDPVYSGKALYGLSQLPADDKPQRVLFIHTGGLPGLLATPELMGFA